MERPMLVLALVLPLVAAATVARADTLGVWVGANYWNFDISGTARYKSTNPADDIDVNSDLGYNDDSLTTLYAVLEHPVPLVPNVKIAGTKIDTSASGVLSNNFTWGDITFTVNEPVTSAVKLNQVDLTLYWRLLDNVANLDLGVNAKYLDLDARITGATSGTDTASATGVALMLYAGAGIDLPLTGLGVDASGSYMGYSGNKFYDFTVRATYDTPWRLGVEGGYRKLKLDLDDFDGSYANIEFSGPYLGAYLHF
ncbi:MAG: TIGR04219 family outer membrane beta-barrel protein [Pseudomonadota bacterium]